MMNLLIGLIVTAHASVAIDGIWRRKEQVEKCATMAREVNGWWGKSEIANSRIVPANKFDRARELLGQIQYPSSGDVALLRSALAEDFANTFPNFIMMAGADCPSLRMALGRALMEASARAPELLPKVRPLIQTLLTAEKYPTLLSVSVDGALLELALTHDLWKATPEQKDSAHAWRADLKADIRKWNEKYEKAFGITFDLRDASADTIARFKALPEYETIRLGAAKEQELVASYRARYEKVRHSFLAP